MKADHGDTRSRRRFLQVAGILAAGAAACSLPGVARAAATKIGVIGSGRLGGTVGELWVTAGHEVMFSSLDLEHDKALAARLGGGARAGTPKDAATFGEVLLFAVPYAALPQLGRDLAAVLKGKVVLDACNPIPSRDGEMATAALAKGTGVASPELLPGARLVRAFNCVGAGTLRSEAHRTGERIGIPLAGDDGEALRRAAQLVRDAGFDPVVVGGLARARNFDYGTPIFGKGMTAAEVRKLLGLTSK